MGMTENFPRRVEEVEQEASQVDMREELDRLRAEGEELRAARRRLVLAADDDRRRIERKLHGGVQQHLVALAVRIQLVESALRSDPAAAEALLEEIGRDVQDAVDEAARLAQRVYVPLLQIGLAAALRAAAVGAGVPASVEVGAGSSGPPETLNTVYTCWLEALEQPCDPNPAIIVRENAGSLVFDVIRGAGPTAAGLDALRDRVEALGGELTIRSEAEGRRIRVSGSIPL